jgi:hypothetical protein
VFESLDSEQHENYTAQAWVTFGVSAKGLLGVEIRAILSHMALTERSLTIPEIMLIAGTRVALGVGVGLLISDRLNKDQRKAAGWALLAVGVMTTIPIVRGVLGEASCCRGA